jgi:hypothetical protein
MLEAFQILLQIQHLQELANILIILLNRTRATSTSFSKYTRAGMCG